MIDLQYTEKYFISCKQFLRDFEGFEREEFEKENVIFMFS